jgi:hypothetical protein
MRTRYWMKKLFGSLLCASAAATATAQDGLVDPNQMFNAQAGAGYAPYIDPGDPRAAQYAVPYTGMEQAGFPPGANPWPAISPFEGPPVDQHLNQGGLWFNQQMRGPRKYYVDMAAGLTQFAAPQKTVVGNEGAPGLFTGTRQFFERHRWSEVRDQLTSGGFVGTLGFFDADGSGWFAGGFWAGEAGSTLDLISPIGDPTRPLDTLLAVAGVPLFDQGSDTILPPVPPATTGVVVPNAGTQPYDMQYRLEWQSQAYGAGLGYYTDPLIQTGTFKLRPLVGLRYLNTRENARFRGQDSGLNYTIDPADRRPLALIGLAVPAVFESQLSSTVQTQMGGPELGIRYDLGGEKFLIYGSTKLGLLANHSTREIKGFGIGRNISLINPTPINPVATGFNSQDTTTSASPVFEQSVFIKAPLLSYVPGIRKMKLFETADFQLGYTFMAVGSTYRPSETINWRGYPDFPTIQDNKSTFFFSTWSFGVEWNF